MRNTTYAIGFVSVSWLMACGEDSLDPVVATANVDAAAATQDASAPDAIALSCQEGSLRGCVCTSGGTGTQSCTNGSYGACTDCNTNTKTKCVAGVYTDIAMGKVRSVALGLGGVIAPFALDTQDKWSYSLKASGNGEFYVIEGGCAHGVTGSGTSNEARAYISGQVDCATGELAGSVKGFYTTTSLTSWVDPMRFYYKGEVHAQFDPDTQVFSGVFTLKEPPVQVGEQPGGSGTFNATLSEEELANETEEQCLGDFPEALFPD